MESIDITMRARVFSYNPSTNRYLIRISHAALLSSSANSLVFEVAPYQIHKASQTQLLHEEDLCHIHQHQHPHPHQHQEPLPRHRDRDQHTSTAPDAATAS